MQAAGADHDPTAPAGTAPRSGDDGQPGGTADRAGAAGGQAEWHPAHHPDTRHDEQVYGITTADEGLSADLRRRQKQYILSMLFRAVSVAVVVFIPGIVWPVKIGLCVVATIIPYVAVVRANGRPPRDAQPTNLLIGPPQRPELEDEDPGLPAGPRVVPGEAWVSGSRAADEAGPAEPEAANRAGERAGQSARQPEPEPTRHASPRDE